MAPVVVPIVHYVGPQIFANELHEPVALVVIECVVERLRCVGDLAQFRGLHGVGVGVAPHLTDVIQPRVARVTLSVGVSSLLVFRDRSVRCYGNIAGGSPCLQVVGRRPALGAFRCDVV